MRAYGTNRPCSILYAELFSMVQHYDLMVSGLHHIGYLPECSSRKTPEDIAELLRRERGELLGKIRSYLDNHTMECCIIVPTCLRTPVLILDPKECMRRYHKPELQGAFPTQFLIKGFGFVQLHNDLCRSIIPPNFRQLPFRVATVMTTLIWQDIMAADAVYAEYNSPLSGLPPLLSCSHVMSTTDPHHARRPSGGAESSDMENACCMAELSMEEAKCSLVREVVSCQGHSHLRCPPTSHAACSPARELYDHGDDMASPRRSVSMRDLSIVAAKRDLASA